MSKSDDDMMVIGGLALLAMLVGKGRSVNPATIPWGTGWYWPVAPIRFANGETYDPVISNGFDTIYPDGTAHAGVDIMFRRKSPADKAAEYRPGSVNGSTMFFAPPGTPIIAARDARVWATAKTSRGLSVVLDHGAPFATFYQHLERVDIEPHANGKPLSGGSPTIVKAGDYIGTMGGDPSKPPHLRHLHFAVWYKGSGDKASVDPAAVIGKWSKVAPWGVP